MKLQSKRSYNIILFISHLPRNPLSKKGPDDFGSVELDWIDEIPKKGPFYILEVSGEKVKLTIDMRRFFSIIKSSFSDDEISQISGQMMSIMIKESKNEMIELLEEVRRKIDLDNNFMVQQPLHKFLNHIREMVWSLQIYDEVEKEAEHLLAEEGEVSFNEMLYMAGTYHDKMIDNRVLQKFITMVVNQKTNENFEVIFVGDIGDEHRKHSFYSLVPPKGSGLFRTKKIPKK